MSTNVTVTNTTVFVQNLNSAGQPAGMQPIPSDASVQATLKIFAPIITSGVTGAFKSAFPGVSVTTHNPDFGTMGPYSANVAGTAPQCCVDQITMDFVNWLLPTDTNTPTQIAEAITEELTMQVGMLGYTTGQVQLNPNETICWAAGYAEFQIDQNGNNGVVYAFTAGLQVG